MQVRFLALIPVDRQTLKAIEECFQNNFKKLVNAIDRLRAVLRATDDEDLVMLADDKDALLAMPGKVRRAAACKSPLTP